MDKTEKRGGSRPGAGRKTGYKKPEGTRKNRTLKAYDDEWTYIKEFAAIIKKSPEAAKKLIAMMANMSDT